MQTLDNRGEPYKAFLYLEHPMIVKLMGKADLKTVPQIWHEGQYVGGYTELLEYLKELDQ
jgi:glutaredoxin-related protein